MLAPSPRRLPQFDCACGVAYFAALQSNETTLLNAGPDEGELLPVLRRFPSCSVEQLQAATFEELCDWLRTYAWHEFVDPWDYYSPECVEARWLGIAEGLEEDPPAFESYMPQTRVRQTAKVGRNDPCLWRSGQKYKKCCLDADR